MSQHRLQNDLRNANFVTTNADMFQFPQCGTNAHALAFFDTAARTQYPVTSTASTRFINLYWGTTASTGDARGIYQKLFLSSGATGESIRSVTVVESDTPDAGSTCNGAHISLDFGSSAGNIVGDGYAVKGTLHIPNRTLNGTVAALKAEVWTNGASSDASNCSLLYAGIGGTAKATLEDSAFLLNIDCGTNASGNLVGAVGNEPTWASNTYLIRCKLNGTTAYLVAVTV